ncbi:MBL fold metallo-hydrolase [Bacillus wiedmannii]|uniref:Metallo-beta-lactamase domain-containing protein n=1 Tax=Bacillus wiedmannii TaxID=1890302 RepID=A0A2B5NPE5_9BACI|nr:MBL fold metallo-hydrolase [Bacillus wiedmannii]KMP76509.1 membrane protein [Bacillus cereus]MBG9854222.1 membrane protein [Bacillus wiedmannii]MCQ6547051.1 MBL fold metallo-hydrolase [Bacillus wiedmannii]MCQ6572340.1 MBL fold metallo-hydrolase [Bacillus wiedmannii]MCU5578760.1 MBL fold metallo-hydrolase [Bacillus wiedmannii]
MKKKYMNQIHTDVSFKPKDIIGLMTDYFKMKSKLRPVKNLPIVLSDKNNESLESVTWFGHSASLVKIEGKTLLLDPMFGDASSPFPLFNSKRYSGAFSLERENLQEIDAIIISHNHYDHLNYKSIMQLKDRAKHFYVPTGVAQYLMKWGVSPSKISEHNWWDEIIFDNIKLVCAPARHFSGRSMTDRDCSLWCSWLILGQETKVFFSGDSGYAPHFKEIGDKYGPFDLTLMECGQYDLRWSAIHMLPEETVQAHIDVKGELLLPIHWGAFTLALHEWSDPIERVTKEAKRLGVKIVTPQIGESTTLKSTDYPSSDWWREI